MMPIHSEGDSHISVGRQEAVLLAVESHPEIGRLHPLLGRSDEIVKVSVILADA